MILAGDVGGTNARLALFEARADGLALRALETYASREHRGLEELVRTFRTRHPAPVDAAGFGVAGPVREGRVATTNLPWVVDAREMAAALALRDVALLNDLEALAWSLDLLPPQATVTLQAGRPAPRGTLAVIAAGTGLGEAALARLGDRAVAFPGEGGHADFAPRDER